MRDTGRRTDWMAPVPVTDPHRRLTACVLAAASRLAPLAAGDPDTPLRSFLAGLPEPVLAAAARLAARTLPGSAGLVDTDPAEAVAEGLRVVQLVGTHRVNTR